MRFCINEPAETIKGHSFIEVTMKNLFLTLSFCIVLTILTCQNCQGFPTNHHVTRVVHHRQKRQSEFKRELEELQSKMDKLNVNTNETLRDNIFKIFQQFLGENPHLNEVRTK